MEGRSVSSRSCHVDRRESDRPLGRDKGGKLDGTKQRCQ